MYVKIGERNQCPKTIMKKIRRFIKFSWKKREEAN